MKFSITQENFAKALLFVNKSLLSKANLPILSNVLINAAGGKMEIVATDLETATRAVVECKVLKEGRVCASGKILQEFVSQLPSADLSLERLGEELLVNCSKYSARISTMPVEEFPAIPKIEKGKNFTFDAQELSGAIGKVAFCAALDEGRPALTGVLFEFSKASVSMVATDGYRLSFQKIPVKFDGEFNNKIIVPAKALIEVAKIIAESGENMTDIVLTVAQSLNQINFEIGDVEFTSRLIEGEFPAWQKIIPTSFTTKAKINKDELTKIVKMTSIFARESGNIIKFKLESAGKEKSILAASANNSQVGSNEAQMEVELSGKGGEIAFNFRYLLEVLATLEAQDINFEMIESLNPGRISFDDSGSYFHIVMPVRLQS